MFIDVDRFKVVNDSLGHESGDWLLQQIGARLTQAVRASDSVARFGGDEFVILFDGVADEPTAMKLTDRVRRELMRPFSLEGEEDFFATRQPRRRAQRRHQRRRRAACATPTPRCTAPRRPAARSPSCSTTRCATRPSSALRTERALRRGPAARRAAPALPADLSTSTSGRIEAVEALVRWERPGHGLVAPGAFIGVAEECGLIVAARRVGAARGLPPGRRVARRAGRRGAAAGPRQRLRRASSTQPDLAGVVARALRDAGLDPADLVLEITETGLLERTERPASVLRAIKATGVRIALDDFGTGYSSLSYLERFPIDELKLDREFVGAARRQRRRRP